MIDWSKIDPLIIRYLPLMTCVDFCKKHRLDIVPRTIGQRAKKLGVKPIKYRPTEEHKAKTSSGLKKAFLEKDKQFVIDNLNKISRKKIALRLDVSIPVLNTLISDLGLVIDPDAQRRFHREGSSLHVKKAARSLWNKFRNDESFASDISASISAKSRELWKNELYRLKVIGGIRRRYDSSDLRQRLSNIGKKRFCDDPRVREILLADRQFKTSRLNDRVASKLEGFGVLYEREFEVANYKFDFKIDNILLEVNGDYWHSLPDNMRNDRAKRTLIEKYYPQYRVCTIWESEIKSVRGNERLLEILGIQKVEPIEIILDELVFIEASTKDVDKFLDSFHYLGSTNRKRHCYGLTLHNSLMAVAVFGAPVRLNLGKGRVLELIRLCGHPRFHNKNLMSFFLAKCESALRKLDKYDMIVSFADKRLHDGTVYRAANWEDLGDTASDYNYMSVDNIPMHKKTLYNRARASGMRERDYAELHGMQKVNIGCKRKFRRFISTS